MTLAHHRGGSGAPLLLVHGLGSHWHVWEPVLPRLEREREVVAVDLPGFGESAPLPAGTEPTPGALTDAVASFLDELGWQAPAVAGNSLGGLVVLELARRGRARSTCAISPAGLWRGWERTFCDCSLRATRASALRLAPHADQLLARPRARKLVFGQIAEHAERLTPKEAAAALRNVADSPGFDATRAALMVREVERLDELPESVTIAWGTKDRLLLPRQGKRARELAPRVRHVSLLGVGHVPMWDDPELVARTILESAA